MGDSVTLHGFVLHGRDVFEAGWRNIPVPAGPFLPGPSGRVAAGAKRRHEGANTGGLLVGRLPVLLVLPGGTAAVPALAIPAAAASVFAPAAVLVTSAGRRAAAAPLLVSLPLSFCPVEAHRHTQRHNNADLFELLRVFNDYRREK